MITGLGVGGAEKMLLKLVSRLASDKFHVQVISLGGDGPLGDAFRNAGVQLNCIGSALGLYDPVRLVKLTLLLRRSNPDIVQGWMYHGNTAASLACFLGRIKAPVMWNVRGSNAVSDGVRFLGRLNHQLSTYLSSGAKWIVNNSLTSAIQHELKLGYPPSKRVILPNGFDSNEFQPDETKGVKARLSLNISNSTVVIGYVGRDHIDKDVANFFAAARALSETTEIQRDIAFVVAGQGLIDGCSYWQELDEENRSKFRFLGVVEHVANLLPAFDILVLSSRRENFPNVLGESMCCGIPVVATNVGDCEALVGDASLVVPPESPELIRAALLRLVRMEKVARKALGVKLRARAIANYSLDEIVARYAKLYESTAAIQGPTCAA